MSGSSKKPAGTAFGSLPTFDADDELEAVEAVDEEEEVEEEEEEDDEAG
jgi:hypothetical protein